MSGISRLPFMAGTLSIGALVAAIATIPSLRHRLDILVGPSAVRNMLKALAVVVALINLKNLPFLWHWRVLKGLVYQIYIQPTERTPRTLFAPMITSSYNSPYDTDYNLHKSNSTYFADLDVARAHYVGSVIRTGLTRLNAGDEVGLPAETKTVRGRYSIALGAVACYFQREIPPLKQFDVYTRLLSWDRKWLYLVSHVVEKGKIRPDAYALQPWKNHVGDGGRRRKQDEQEWKKYLYASSVARYVCKKGRLTINPEIVLERSRLLPVRPEGVGFPPRSEGSMGSTPAAVGTPLAEKMDRVLSPEKVAAAVSSKLNGDANADVKKSDPVEEEGWTWETMEAERLRGLKMAGHFDALAGLHDELRAGEVLGEYSDWF